MSPSPNGKEEGKHFHCGWICKPLVGGQLPYTVLAAADEGGPVQVDSGRGVAAQIRSTPTVAIPTEADRLTPLPVQLAAGPSYRLTDGPRAELPASVATLPETGETEISLGQTLEELDPGREAAIEAFWALLAELGYEPV